MDRLFTHYALRFPGPGNNPGELASGFLAAAKELADDCTKTDKKASERGCFLCIMGGFSHGNGRAVSVIEPFAVKKSDSSGLLRLREG